MSLVPTRKETPQIMHTARRVPPQAGGHSSGAPRQGGGGTGITGKDIIRILRRRIWLIVFSTFIFTVAAGVSTFLWLKYAPLYTAKAFLQVNPPKSSDMSAGSSSMNEAEMDRLMMTQTQAVVLETVIGKALEGIYHTKWYNDVNAEGEDPVQKLIKDINVSIVPKTKLISISMTGQDKNEIAEISNAVAEASVKDTKEGAGESHSEAISRIQYERKNFENIRDQNAAIIQALQDRGVGGEAIESRETITLKQSECVKKLSELREQFKFADEALKNTMRVTDEELAQQPEVQQMLTMDPELQQIRNRVLGLQIELESTQQRFGPGHKAVVRLETSLNSAKAMMEKKEKELIQRSVQQLRYVRERDFGQIEKSILEQEKYVAGLDEKLKNLDNQDKDLANAKEEKDKAEKIIMDMDNRIRDLRMLKRGEEPLVLFRRAVPPEKPSQPKYVIMLPAGFMLGLMLGVGLAFLLEFLDTSIKAPSDVSRRVELPLLGMIPHLDDVEEEIEDMRLAFMTNPKAIISEAFRQTRTTLMFSGTAEHQRSILISSAMPEDGRTTIALNLAHAVASGGKKVLVVDANFRQPMFRTLFPGCPDGGLSTALVGQADWRSLVYKVEPNFDIMASGPLPPNPADLLGSEQMQKQIAEFYQDYDQVIFDSSPCLVVSDAVTLSTMVDGAILVVRAGVNTYGIVQRARDMITRLGTPIFGVVLNGVRVTAGGYLRKNYETFYEYREKPQLEAPQTAEVAAEITVEDEDEKES